MAERIAASRAAAAQAGPVADDDRAALPARVLSYVLDSIVLFAFSMLFMALAGLNIFLRSDQGDSGISNADQWTTVAILAMAMPVWLLLNVAIMARKSCTVGQYIVGLQVQREDGGRPGSGRLLAYWLALHPLFFHPFFAGIWVLIAGLSLLSDIAFIACLAMALLCIAAPFAALVFAAVDPQRRTIHDHLAGIKVVRLA
jgi:uncharacterized RDD family membrane protein YckC